MRCLPSVSRTLNIVFVSPTLNVNLKLFVILCKIKLLVIDFQCWKFCHLLSDFLESKFQSSMIIIHYKHVRIRNTPRVGELEGDWGDTFESYL